MKSNEIPKVCLAWGDSRIYTYSQVSTLWLSESAKKGPPRQVKKKEEKMN
jgi:hypothetical protein